MQTRIKRHPEYLDVQVLGLYHPGAGLALVRHVVDLAKTEGTNLVLLDASEMDGDFSLEQRYAVAEKAAEFMPDTIRMGVVAHPMDVGVPVMEVVAVEKGLPLRVFQSREDAASWLVAGDQRP